MADPNYGPIPIFISGTGPDPSGRKGAVKRFHKRSRTGCQKCRARRVKCDETKPVCRNCLRNNAAECVYDRQTEDNNEDGEGSSKPTIPTALVETLESRERRIQELDLLHFYMAETAPAVSFDSDKEDQASSYDLWVKTIPRMAFKSEALLNSIYATTSLHRSRTTGGPEPGVPSPKAADAALEMHEIYLDRALKKHRADLGTLSRENADVILMTANLLRLVSIFQFSQRSLSPYTPPVDWMRSTQSYRDVYRIAWQLVGDDTSTQASKLTRTTPLVPEVDLFDELEQRRKLEYILRGDGAQDGYMGEIGDMKTWDMEVLEAYKTTIRHIDGILQAIKKHVSLRIIGRHIVLFPMYVPGRFIDMVGESRPRALVIMAHYFALYESLKDFWYVGNTGKREVMAIKHNLPDHWQSYMEWPMQMVEHGLPSGILPTP